MDEKNEVADVTADGFTERVNKGDFRAKYWKEAGGKFNESEQTHLDDTPATEVKDEGERAEGDSALVLHRNRLMSRRLCSHQVKPK
jgi:hypothetical protein